ncbi:hypothetical protein C5167_038522 [Papaver somniferum]|uniref:Uncharacterized protein n=1 Tax=Papaver somniferum TaxID=3469 RepID=A0A4Y7I9E6_PAPSO|nr:hypothetical protein C5167_038522 [Papaver somniferum]
MNPSSLCARAANNDKFLLLVCYFSCTVSIQKYNITYFSTTCILLISHAAWGHLTEFWLPVVAYCDVLVRELVLLNLNILQSALIAFSLLYALLQPLIMALLHCNFCSNYNCCFLCHCQVCRAFYNTWDILQLLFHFSFLWEINVVLQNFLSPFSLLRADMNLCRDALLVVSPIATHTSSADHLRLREGNRVCVSVSVVSVQCVCAEHV